MNLRILTRLVTLVLAVCTLAAGPTARAAAVTASGTVNWSALTGGSGAGDQPNASDTVSVSSGATLTVDTTATCGALTYVAPASGASGTVTISGKIMISNSPIHESRRKCLSASAGRQTPRFA